MGGILAPVQQPHGIHISTSTIDIFSGMCATGHGISVFLATWARTTYDIGRPLRPGSHLHELFSLGAGGPANGGAQSPVPEGGCQLAAYRRGIIRGRIMSILGPIRTSGPQPPNDSVFPVNLRAGGTPATVQSISMVPVRHRGRCSVFIPNSKVIV